MLSYRMSTCILTVCDPLHVNADSDDKEHSVFVLYFILRYCDKCFSLPFPAPVLNYTCILYSTPTAYSVNKHGAPLTSTYLEN